MASEREEVLCQCGHGYEEHSWGDSADECEMCNCKEFQPLATFSQLKAAWELVDDIPNMTYQEILEAHSEILELNARSISGEGGR